MFESGYNGGSAGMGAFGWFLFAVIYFYFAYTQFRIAQKCNCRDTAWWSFIPILNLFLLTRMANKEWWWFVLCFVPIINIVAFVMLWYEAAKISGNSPIWGFLMWVPLLNIVALAVMAFSSNKEVYQHPTETPTRDAVRREPTHIG